MNFRRNVLLRSGMTQTSDRSRLMILCSGIGLIGAIIVGGWQAFALMLAGIKHQLELEVQDESKQITNRAGLPTLEGNGTSAASEEIPTEGYSNQMVTQKYLQP